VDFFVPANQLYRNKNGKVPERIGTMKSHPGLSKKEHFEASLVPSHSSG